MGIGGNCGSGTAGRLLTPGILGIPGTGRSGNSGLGRSGSGKSGLGRSGSGKSGLGSSGNGRLGSGSVGNTDSNRRRPDTTFVSRLIAARMSINGKTKDSLAMVVMLVWIGVEGVGLYRGEKIRVGVELSGEYDFIFLVQSLTYCFSSC